MVNAQVQETMLLLAEALTVDFQIEEALNLYKQILDSREQSSESTKEKQGPSTCTFPPDSCETHLRQICTK